MYAAFRHWGFLKTTDHLNDMGRIARGVKTTGHIHDFGPLHDAEDEGDSLAELVKMAARL